MSNPSLRSEQNAFYPDQNQFDFTALPLSEWPVQIVPEDEDPHLHLVANNGALLASKGPQYRLGDPGLPLAPMRDHILSTVENNQVSVLIGELGSGKSSNTPLYFLESTDRRIFVSEPRILAARGLMEFARANVGSENEHLVGYITGNADDSDCPETARLIYVTEDLLLRIINRGQLREDDLIIYDEAHERNPGGIVSLGLLEEEDILEQHPDLRVLVTSATIPKDEWKDHLNGAPVIEVGGRVYPITIQETNDEVPMAMRNHMRRGRNVLAFEPGTGPLRTTWARAQSGLDRSHRVHMLHGNLSPREQRAALVPDDNNHIVATRVAETSITPENKDVVVDGGRSNLGMYVQGKHILRTEFSSKATMRQRMGRIGRTRPGIYEIAIPADSPPPPAFDDRPEYDPSPIENSCVSAYILELLSQGRRLERLHLIERPTEANLRHDYAMLQRLGAITLVGPDEYKLTEAGYAMIDLPVDSSQARMLVEARRYARGEVDGNADEAIRLQVAALVAIQQVKGIFDTQQGKMRFMRRKHHQEFLSDERTSDALFELDVFVAMYLNQQHLLAGGREDAEEMFERLLKNTDILPNRYYKALNTYQELCRREGLTAADLQKPKGEQREHIIACQIVGAEELFVRQGSRTYRDICGERNRSLGRRSIVSPVLAELVIGTAFNLQGLRKTGRFEKRFIYGGSIVTVDQLVRHIPERISRAPQGFGVNDKGKLVEKHAMYFDGELKFANLEGPLPPTVESRAALITAMMLGVAPDIRKPNKALPYKPGTPRAAAAVQMWKRAQELDHKSPVNFRTAERYQKLIKKTIRQSLEEIPLDITDPAGLDALIPRVYLNSLVRPTKKQYLPEVLRMAPDGITIHSGDETEEYIPVTYRNDIAYVSVPRGKKFTMRREDFVGLTANHDIKIRIGNGKYVHLDAMFERIDSEREAEALRQAKAAERREMISATYQKRKQKAEYKERMGLEEEERMKAKRDLQRARIKKPKRGQRTFAHVGEKE